MINFDCYRTDDPDTILSQLKPQRDWMESHGYAYNCPPLVLSNQLGWGISFPKDISFIWNDSEDESGIEVISGEEYCSFGRGQSIICFTTNLIFKTNSNLSLLTIPVPNQITEDSQCLTSILSSSFYTGGFQVVWKILSRNKVITIKAGTPVASIIPLSLSELNQSSITMHKVEVPNYKHNDDYMNKMKERDVLKNGFANWYRDGLDQNGNVIGKHETKRISLYVVEGDKR